MPEFKSANPNRFEPIIQHGSDGSQIFRTDMVDIVFPLNQRIMTMRFDLSETEAPPIPFRYVGDMDIKGTKYIFVIDTNGDAWAETEEALMKPVRADALIMSLYHINDYRFKIVSEMLGRDDSEALLHEEMRSIPEPEEEESNHA